MTPLFFLNDGAQLYSTIPFSTHAPSLHILDILSPLLTASSAYRKTMSWWGRCSCCRTSRRGCRPGGAGRPAPRTSRSPCSASPPAHLPPAPGSPPGSLKKKRMEKNVNFQLRCTELKNLMLAYL
jgi:hypothetical protein